MRDPRLLEIDFLTAVERGSTTSVHIPMNSPELFFAVDARSFRRMVAHLLIVGSLNGPDEFGPNENFQPVAALGRIEQLKSYYVHQVLRGLEVSVSVSHSGRIRLVELREALDRNRLRDAFGLLFDQRYWLRDLFVRLLDASESTPLSLIAIDLDNFKAVNDNHGHGAGDDVLRACFQRVLDVVGDRGDAYRRGGDEVVVFMPRTTLAEAQTLAEQLRGGFAEEFNASYAGVTPTLSIGVSEVVERAEADVVSAHVDGLAIRAKQAGKNRVVARRFPSPT